jgi:hypothetical protein
MKSNKGDNLMELEEYVEVWNRTVGKAIDDIFAKAREPESDQDLADEAEDRNIESYLEEKRGI